MEIVVTPKTTHILIQHVHNSRRIFTDGRDWPDEIELSFAGYSIGKWIDTDGDGRYDVLEVETRDFKGPRAYDAHRPSSASATIKASSRSGFIDKAEPNVLYNEITTIDKALTRPWTATKNIVASKETAGLARGGLLRRQCSRRDRWADLFPQCGWASDAGPEEPAPA